jgi:hypothetical protein
VAKRLAEPGRRRDDPPFAVHRGHHRPGCDRGPGGIRGSRSGVATRTNRENLTGADRCRD